MAEYSPTPRKQQDERRFNRPVNLHVAASWVVAKLARERAITLEHALVIADLAEIGGKQK